MDLTGINRTTAQRMTAKLRASMRAERRAKALMLLRKGEARALVARSVGLSPSSISVMFKGPHSPARRPWAHARTDHARPDVRLR